jgi:hypothetical protein
VIAPYFSRNSADRKLVMADAGTRGVVDTISRQSSKVGLHYLDYRGQTVRW